MSEGVAEVEDGMVLLGVPNGHEIDVELQLVPIEIVNEYESQTYMRGVEVELAM